MGILSPDWLGILSSLAAALAWGGADFSGGQASRRSDPFQVLTLAALSGTTMLCACAWVGREAWPSTSSLVWAAAAGGSAALGNAALYRALSLGNTATAAPTAAVVGAILPVIFSMFTEGWPGMTRLVGFVLALIGIGLASGAATAQHARRGLALAGLAGISFAGFFILMAQIEDGTLFVPLIAARCAALGVAVIMLLGRGLPLPALTSNPTALWIGVMDTAGNIFYVLAMQFTRLDIAVVLSTMYPAATILLARTILGEKIARGQWLGAATCLVAISLIVL